MAQLRKEGGNHFSQNSKRTDDVKLIPKKEICVIKSIKNVFSLTPAFNGITEVSNEFQSCLLCGAYEV